MPGLVSQLRGSVERRLSERRLSRGSRRESDDNLQPVWASLTSAMADAAAQAPPPAADGELPEMPANKMGWMRYLRGNRLSSGGERRSRRSSRESLSDEAARAAAQIAALQAERNKLAAQNRELTQQVTEIKMEAQSLRWRMRMTGQGSGDH